MFKSFKGISFITICVIAIIVAMIVGPNLIETVPAGNYDICQNIFNGNLSSHMKTGPYLQMFGKIYRYPVADTFYFTSDKEGDTKTASGDYSIHVQFMDGSTCSISGTCRVEYPKSDKDAVALLSEHGYKNADDVEDRLILPVVRRSLMLSANFITAKESYSDRRAEFISEAWDQIENGVFVTKEKEVKEADPLSGQFVTRIRKVKVVDEKTGKFLREKNPLEGLGVRLTNFEVKQFVYSETVTKQITKQQEALMDVQTAKANAQKFEQDGISAEAKGKADVVAAKYLKETEKIKAIVSAEQEKEVAETSAAKTKAVALIEASKNLEVAEKERQTAEIKLKIAELEKKSLIEKANGEAAYKEKVFLADNGLVPKLEAMCKINESWANAFKERKVPSIVSGGKGGADGDALNFMELLTAKTAQDLALQMDVKKAK